MDPSQKIRDAAAEAMRSLVPELEPDWQGADLVLSHRHYYLSATDLALGPAALSEPAAWRFFVVAGNDALGLVEVSSVSLAPSLIEGTGLFERFAASPELALVSVPALSTQSLWDEQAGTLEELETPWRQEQPPRAAEAVLGDWRSSLETMRSLQRGFDDESGHSL